MTTYRVEISGEFEGLACVGGADLVVNGVPIRLPDSLLTKVPPPLPPEPPDESIVRTDQFFWERCDGGADQAGVGDRWWRNEDQGWEDWAGICEYGTPVRFLPAPEPVELPWSGFSMYGAQLKVGVGEEDPIGVRINLEYASLRPDIARDMARALNTAADQAKATS